MKKNIFVRILAGMGGAALWLLALGMLAETFFHVPVTAKAGQLLNAGSPLAVLAVLLCAIVLCVFGTCCVLALSSKRAAKRQGFVMQKGENGVIGVSVKSIEGLVMTCVKQHDVVERAEISVVERRDGIVILLNIQETAGVNIPLAVGALQKQIRQYVNECTGVDVHEVRVMVENTDNDAVESLYAVAKPVVMTTAVTAAAMRREEPAPEVQTEQVTEPVVVEEAPVAEEMPVQEEPAELPVEEELPAAAEEAPSQEVPVVMAAPVLPEIPPMPELIAEEDDRPLHQRLFGAEEQPVFVPVPPEMMAPPVVEELPDEEPETMVAEAAEETPEEAESSDEIAADAVLEVVQAIAQEEDLPAEDEQPEEYDFEYDEEALAEQAALEGDDDERDAAALEHGI